MSERKAKSGCVCGQPLPHRLADLADDRFTHVCSCERAYKVRDGAFVLVGAEVNPVARFDAMQAKPVHRGAKVGPDGQVSALCFKRPRAIDLRRATWTNRDEAVTCPACKKALAERKGRG